MLITDLFTITIDRIYFNKERVIAYDVTIYSDEVGDFEVVKVNVDGAVPFGLYIDEYNFSLAFLDVVDRYYKSVTEFLDDLLAYLQKVLIEGEK